MTDRIRAFSEEEAASAGAAPAALVAITTFLEGCTIKQLSRVVALSHSATVRLVDKLEEQGLVVRRSSDDGRAVALHPTRRGRTRGAAILAARERATEDLLGELPSDQRRTLVGLMEELLAILVHHGADPFQVCRLCDADACGHWSGRCPVTEVGRQRATPEGG
ncbi:MAG: MarR family winged helix-turn-helix transcriptional regulator [Solirubrobacterales bacterium]